MKLAQAVLIAVSGLMVGACGEADVLIAPDNGLFTNPDVQSPEYQPCIETGCEPGYTCVDNQCVQGEPPDAGGPEDLPDPSVVEPDAGPAPDPGPTDTGPPDPPDPGVIPDTAPPPDPGPSVENACPIPGQAKGCEAIELCRYNEQTKATECSSSTVVKPHGAPCLQHVECDILYGCHFGVCTTYCEVAFPASCSVGTCSQIGHPQFGACKLEGP